MARDPAVVLVIPARFASSRFPGKPLALLAGKPVIQHVYERAATASGVDRVVVATDDDRIQSAVHGFGGTVLMTGRTVRTGTDRVAAVAAEIPGRVFVNLQADEIPLDPRLVSDLVAEFQASGVGMGTLKRRMHGEQDLMDPALVKVVTDEQGRALYFSRASIPHARDHVGRGAVAGLHYLHLGIYIYTRETLERLEKLPTGQLEEAEKLEQLRALEHGIPVHVWETSYSSLRIDRPEDLDRATQALLDAAPVTSRPVSATTGRVDA